MDKAPKRGAPPKPPEARKTNMLMIRLTESERDDCEAAAELDGLKTAAWARKAIVGTAKRRIARGQQK